MVVGEFDAEEEQIAADAYAAGISASAKIIMPGAGHMVPLEQSDVFNRVLLKFFSLQVGDQHQN